MNNTYYNMNKKLIRLTESDLHRMVKESVNRILNEYTNGFTEKLYNNMAPDYHDSAARAARKRAARDYLADRWQRENGLSDDQVDAVDGTVDDMYKANLPGTFLKRLDQDNNMAAARGMSKNLNRRGGRKPLHEPWTPQEPPQPKKKGFFDRFK